MIICVNTIYYWLIYVNNYKNDIFISIFFMTKKTFIRTMIIFGLAFLLYSPVFAGTTIWRSFYVRSTTNFFWDSVKEKTFQDKVAKYDGDQVYLSMNGDQRQTYLNTTNGSQHFNVFVKSLNASWIKVDVLIGDVSYIYPENKATTLAKIAMINDYNRKYGWLNQIHIDLEPHTLTDRSRDGWTKTDTIIGQYLTILKSITDASDMKVCVDIHWLYKNMSYNGVNLVQKILDNVDCIAVMDYVTNASYIRDRWLFFQNLADQNGKEFRNAVSFDDNSSDANSFYYKTWGDYLDMENILVNKWIKKIAIHNWDDFDTFWTDKIDGTTNYINNTFVNLIKQKKSQADADLFTSFFTSKYSGFLKKINH